MPSSESRASFARPDAAAQLDLRRAAAKRARAMSRLSLLAFMLPVAATIFYLWILATPRYASEARFVVRGLEAPSAAASAPGGGMLAGIGGGASEIMGFADGYAVRDMLKSRDGMMRLKTKIDFAATLQGSGADPLWQFASNPSDDELYDAYRRMVGVRYNMLEQIVVLEVQAFTPEAAVTITKGLLTVAEEFADHMNQRARQEALRVADASVTEAQLRAQEARAAIAEWRAKNSNVDPTLDVTMLNTLITQQESELLQAESDLAMIRQAGIYNTPRRSTVEQRIQTLRRQIASAQARLTGGKGATSARMMGYEMLQSNLLFAESNLTAMRQTAEQAKLSMLQQQRFVAVVANPMEDHRPAAPDKMMWLGYAFLAGLALAFLGSVLVGLARTRRMTPAL